MAITEKTHEQMYKALLLQDIVLMLVLLPAVLMKTVQLFQHLLTPASVMLCATYTMTAVMTLSPLTVTRIIVSFVQPFVRVKCWHDLL